MAPVDHINEPTEVDVLLGFFDLTGYMRISEKLTCLELFALMRNYFDLVGDIVAEGDGWLVKAVGVPAWLPVASSPGCAMFTAVR